MTQRRQPKGIPTGGEFSSNSHAEAGELVREWHPKDREDFDRLRVARDVDYNATREDVVEEVRTSKEHSWERLLGDTKRTKKNIQAYDDYVHRVVANHPHYRAEHVRRANDHAALTSFGRAYTEGIPIDPRADAYFESVWTDPNDPHGELGIRRNIDYQQRLLREITSGVTSEGKPSDVSFLERAIARDQEALRTRGRSHPVNAHNALSRERSGWE